MSPEFAIIDTERYGLYYVMFTLADSHRPGFAWYAFVRGDRVGASEDWFPSLEQAKTDAQRWIEWDLR